MTSDQVHLILCELLEALEKIDNETDTAQPRKFKDACGVLGTILKDGIIEANDDGVVIINTGIVEESIPDPEEIAFNDDLQKFKSELDSRLTVIERARMVQEFVENWKYEP